MGLEVGKRGWLSLGKRRIKDGKGRRVKGGGKGLEKG